MTLTPTCKACGNKTFLLFGRVCYPAVDELDCSGNEPDMILDDNEPHVGEIVYTCVECAECGSTDIDGLDELKKIVKQWFASEITPARVVFKEESEDTTLIGVLARLDWKEILRKSIERRKTSWSEQPVIEWRNASDCVYCSVVEALREAGFDPYRTAVRKND